MSAGIFAIVGVALGSALGYFGQRLMAGRAEEFARRERLRRERMDAYSAFAASAMEARRAQINRWYQRRDAGSASSEYDEAKAESYLGRSAAWRERYRVQLVADDEGLSGLAEAAVKSLRSIPKAETKSGMEQSAKETRSLIERFVTDAAAQLSSHD
ncbi:hypothetical protein [Marmoricola sp. Leaf446]|uniref:hypothetical protein n=1 Tax=Marmoricola sp. Leaf446 TaxID=1736379 RepID=UPI0012E3645A|nr:hypothetical protein [Marmoricola sp. Leaf446]